MKHCPTCGHQAEADGQLQCECAAALPPVRSEPLFSVDRFRSVLIKHGLVDESAIDDPGGYDGYRTLEATISAYRELTENMVLTNT